MKPNSNLMQSKSNCFVRVFLMLTPLFLSATSIIVMPSASAHELLISTKSEITNGQLDPAPIIGSSDFAPDLDKFDFTVDMGLTKLKFDSVAYIDSTHMRFNFHGVAYEGTITISAEASAFDPKTGHTSNSIEIVVAAPLILQTISFANVLPMQVGDKDQVIDVTASSSLDVVVESNTPSVCTIDFSKIHAVAAGTCSVKAIQAGNTFYAAATNVTKTVEVSGDSASVVPEIKPIEVATQLGSALYDPDLANDTYAEVLVAGSQSGSENSHLVKLLIPPQAISTKAVFLVSALSSDEESAAGYFVARITAVTSSGSTIRRFQKAIEINIPAGAKDSIPYWSFDETTWYRLQKLESEVLPIDQHAGYFVEADGRIAILTDYLMYFGLRRAQTDLTISSPVKKLALGTTSTPTVAPSPTLNTGFLTHSFTFMRLSKSLTLDVGLCSDFANETANLFLGTKGKSGSWSWKKISTTALDENGEGVFTIINKFNSGQKLRVMVNGHIEIESDV